MTHNPIDYAVSMNFGNFSNKLRSYLLNNGFQNGVYVNYDCIIDLCNKSISWLVERFIEITKQMLVSFEDVQYFMALYSETANPLNKKMISFRQVCRYILSVIPSLELSMNKASKSEFDKMMDLCQLLALSNLIQMFNQARAIQVIMQKACLNITINDRFVDVDYTDSLIIDINKMLSNKNLRIHKNYIPDYVFPNVVEILGSNCNDIAHYIIDYTSKLAFCKSTIFEITREIIGNENDDFVKGFLFDRANVNLIGSIVNPLNFNIRTRFKPLICLYIDGQKRVFSTPWLIHEAIEEISNNLIPYDTLPNGWNSFQNLINLKRKATDDLGKAFEREVLSVLLSKFIVRHNIVAINNKSLKKQLVPNTTRAIGEIDYIVIDANSEKIYVIDAKCTKTKFYFQSFPKDKDIFLGYSIKLQDKTEWVATHLNDVAKEFKLDNLNGYKVEGLFVTNSLIFYGFFSDYPIIPLDKLLLYFQTGNRLCVIPKS